VLSEVLAAQSGLSGNGVLQEAVIVVEARDLSQGQKQTPSVVDIADGVGEC
jgi:hypothetical protein